MLGLLQVGDEEIGASEQQEVQIAGRRVQPERLAQQWDRRGRLADVGLDPAFRG
jgi:hypothetical protein